MRALLKVSNVREKSFLFSFFFLINNSNPAIRDKLRKLYSGWASKKWAWLMVCGPLIQTKNSKNTPKFCEMIWNLILHSLDKAALDIKVIQFNKHYSGGKRKIWRCKMDGLKELGLPVLGIVAAAAVTFYAVSFSELSEKSFRDLDDSEESCSAGFKSSLSSRQRRARRNAERKQANKP
ncbi:OLC1v1023245C1 [Oldenlandia corymbosa var. corymbosa]|uniref:OLC1v1023245C1 n=1 Tax=Oldenlandia corymbosa var. corymbosa TaxID=529605 RepID=A0AAV1C163_OLDCO|nr:OLC1v1023245C1 [Oldenlandia corymbosa var. corymbosa]